MSQSNCLYLATQRGVFTFPCVFDIELIEKKLFSTGAKVALSSPDFTHVTVRPFQSHKRRTYCSMTPRQRYLYLAGHREEENHVKTYNIDAKIDYYSAQQLICLLVDNWFADFCIMLDTFRPE